jgi:hypothetical protein
MKKTMANATLTVRRVSLKNYEVVPIDFGHCTEKYPTFGLQLINC